MSYPQVIIHNNRAASYGSPNPDGLFERPNQAREYSAPEHQALIATGNGGLTQERPEANGDDAPGEQGHSSKFTLCR